MQQSKTCCVGYSPGSLSPEYNAVSRILYSRDPTTATITPIGVITMKIIAVTIANGTQLSGHFLIPEQNVVVKNLNLHQNISHS